MTKKPRRRKALHGKVVEQHSRKTRQTYSAGGKNPPWYWRAYVAKKSISVLCRREGIAEPAIPAGRKNFWRQASAVCLGTTARQATSAEVKELRVESLWRRRNASPTSPFRTAAKKSMTEEVGDTRNGVSRFGETGNHSHRRRSRILPVNRPSTCWASTHDILQMV